MNSKIVLSISLALLCATVSGYSVNEATLIDFANYKDQMTEVVNKDYELYSAAKEANPNLDLQAWGYPNVNYTPSDWDLASWKVVFTSSADMPHTRINSAVRPAQSQKYGTVLGARIYFPEWKYASWAKVMPPFRFFAYYSDGTSVVKEGVENPLTIGIIPNVRVVTEIKSWIFGLNYNLEYSIRLKDSVGRVSQYKMGNLRYEGWRRFAWENKEYDPTDESHFENPKPLYPNSVPYIMFESFLIYKPQDIEGADFITYIKDIDVSYDKAVVAVESDIDNEAVWGILAERRIKSKKEEVKKLVDTLYRKRIAGQARGQHDEGTAQLDNQVLQSADQLEQPAQ